MFIQSKKIVFVIFFHSFSWPNQYKWAQSKVNNSVWGKTPSKSKDEKLQINIAGAQEKQVIGGLILLNVF